MITLFLKQSMKHSTFDLLKRAHLGDVNYQALKEAEVNEPDPYVQHAIQLVSDRAKIGVNWDTTHFTLGFRSGNPREKLEETVFTFLLRLLAIVKEEDYIRSFRKPESNYGVVTAWSIMMQNCIFSITTLLFNAQWTVENSLQLAPLLLELVTTGKVSKLRNFFKEALGIQLSTNCTTDAERSAVTLNFLHVGQFGSSFWRMLHWMAEAIDIVPNDGPNVKLAKNIWRQLVIHTLYRALRCGICMHHMQQTMEQLKTQLLDESTQYGLLWYNIHNKVTSWKTERGIVSIVPEYSEADYQIDAEIYRSVLPK